MHLTLQKTGAEQRAEIMARPYDPFPAASEVAQVKFLEAADPAPTAPPSAPQGAVSGGAHPVLTFEDFPTIPPAAQAIGIDDAEFPGPGFLSDLFDVS